MQFIHLALRYLLLLVFIVAFKPSLALALNNLDVARRYLNYKEVGNNRGAFIDTINKAVSNPLGSPYCSAFVSYCQIQSNSFPKKKTGLATKWIDKNSISALDVWNKKKTIDSTYLVIWQKGSTVFGHIGIVEKVSNKITTIEANTSSGIRGSQSNGNGIYRRLRSIEPFNYFRIKAFTKAYK